MISTKAGGKDKRQNGYDQCCEKQRGIPAADHEVMKDHVAIEDEEGLFYCRAVHGILSYRKDQQVCGIGCPCYVGIDENGYSVCRYQNPESLEELTGSPGKMYQRIQNAIESGKLTLFPRIQRLVELQSAYAFAAQAHNGQFRKGTKIPYLTHLITTMNYCLQMTNDMDVLKAAILHDTLEDTSTTVKDLRMAFGERVTRYVQAMTEDKRADRPAKETWEIRKRESIERLKTASREVKMLALADKTANIESTLREWRRVGDHVWSKFNQSDIEKQAWYYRTCAEVLEELSDTSVMKCYQKYMGELFE